MRTLPPVESGTPDHRSAARYLLWLAVRIWPAITGAMAWAILWFLMQAVTPLVLGKAIDAGLTARDTRALFGWGALLLGLGVVQATAGILRHRLAVYNWLASAMRTVQLAVRQASSLGGALPRRMQTGEVVAVGTTDLNHLGGAVEISARGTGAVVAVVVVTVIMLGTSVPLGLVVLVGVPVLMAVVGLLIRPLHHRQQQYREQQGKLTGRAADIVGGLRVLRGVGGEAVMAARYRSESQDLRNLGVRVAGVESVLEAAQVLLPGVFLAIVTWIGARFALSGAITVGQLVSFYGFAAFLVAPLRTITEAMDKLTCGHVSAGRVKRLLDSVGDLPDPVSPRPWPGGSLIDPASGVRVRAGEFTVLAATDPAQAQAVADRLGRHQPGAVTVGGVPLDGLALATVRRHVLVADNDARLFSGPLRADLAPGGEDVTDALAVACAQDVIAALPDGLDAIVAERGRTFSGGQQQRLRLARALVADPDVLVLVEPTSAVDAHTEDRIADRLRVARDGRTTLVCSTSPLLLDRADRVVFLDGDRVAAEGPHRDLIETLPAYARAVTREDD